MAPTNEDQTIGRLVTKITGLQAGTLRWNKAVQKTKYKLRYEKCTSTSELEVNNSYDGLVQKFDIKGHQPLSALLKEYKAEYLKKSRPLANGDINQDILKYDLLRLLLSLSSSYRQNYDYKPSLNLFSEHQKVTWKDLIKDDPLEGDHWKTWSDGTSTDEDELSDPEGFELEEKEIKQKAPFVMPEYRVDYTDRMDVDHREDLEGLDHLISQQYWRDDYEIQKDQSEDPSLLVNSCKMSQVLGRLFYNEKGREELKTITEVGVIREVLGFLRGFGGVLFQVYENKRAEMNENYIVQHLSQSALGFILKEFYKYGSVLLELRHKVNLLLNTNGQTIQSFAECLYKSLLDFDSTLAVLEADTNMKSEDSDKIISILKLKTMIDPTVACFEAIHDVVLNIPSNNANAKEMAAYLISSLYDRALIAQASGQQRLYNTFSYVLQQTMVPYGCIMDDWVVHGSLIADKFNEFYVTRNDQVSIHDSNFWVDGFSLQPIHQPNSRYVCPIFEPQIMSRIFFTGKAINLLSRVEHIQKQNLLYALDPTLFRTVMSKYLIMKPPFVEPIKNEKTRDQGEKNEYICALFPLAKSQKAASFSIFEENDEGILLDQRFARCMEAYIQEPYQLIASDLNKVLHQHCGLKEHLESLASIYLMLENDLMHSFCEAIFTSIDQNDFWFDQRLLNQVFTDVCETSGCQKMAFIELGQMEKDQSMSMAAYLEYIVFKFEVSWPLNNFIQNEYISKYSEIQRFLFRLKRAKYVMEKKTLFTRAKTKNNSTIMRFYSLRMKILWFINAFRRYIMTTILHAETINFRDKLSLSEDADEISALHNAYIRRLVNRCLLSEKTSAIRKSIMSILDMAEQMKPIYAQCLENNPDIHQLDEALDTLEKDFNRTNEFITISLMIMGRKAGLPWFESLATSLSAQ